MGWFNKAKGGRGLWWMASNADLASSKQHTFYLALSPLINSDIASPLINSDIPSQHINKITDDPMHQEAFSFIKHGDRYGYA